LIVFASRTGNVRYIVNKLNLPSIEINDELTITIPYFIFTYTDGLGDVPKVIEHFLQRNHTLCRGVIASGNTNFGINNFCGSADKISKKYNIPIIHKVELRGFNHDYLKIIDEYNKLIEG